MRRKWRPHFLPSFVLVLVMFMMVGCATTVTESGYQMLYTTGLARDGLMTKAGEYHSMGLIDEEAKNDILEADRAVQKASLAAIAALKAKVRLDKLETVPPEELEEAERLYREAVAEFNKKWAAFTSLLDKYMIEWLIEQ